MAKVQQLEVAHIASHFVTTHRLSEFKHAIAAASKNTLVIFDVDNVLVMPTDEYTLGRNSYRTELWNKLKFKWSKEELKNIESAAIKRSEVTLVDPSIGAILEDLHARQIPTIALTSINTGRYGVIECWEDLQIARLNKCGISFSCTTPFADVPVTNVINNKGVTIRPVCKSGVIVTDNTDKGEVLKHFLQIHNYFPKTIVFIDDKLDNILSLKEMSKACGINFYGFHYTAVQSMTLSYVTEENREKEEYRFKVLEEKGIWLNDKELELYINSVGGYTDLLDTLDNSIPLTGESDSQENNYSGWFWCTIL
ncbi:MAG: DUF2608 domain-containing protein [Rickettsiales bacterium]|nr:DUF2608 domain-containing protein [Rickettsiales bacterium]